MKPNLTLPNGVKIREKRKRFSANLVVQDGDISYLVLYNSHMEPVSYCTIDTIDVSVISQYLWCRHRSGYVQRNVRLGGAHRMELMHRFLMELSSKDIRVVDHINQKKSDNRRSNLRITNMTINNVNKPILGISWHKQHQAWSARIGKSGIKYNLGYFPTAILAKRARDLKFKELYDFEPTK